MTSKVDQTSAEDPASLQMATAASLPAVSTGSTKVSKFASKSGFVIPKNKLSGSLVPIFRGTKKVTEGDIAGEESTKQGQRKTKWGPDLTQDAAVRRGRALAYQTRVDQIVKQLESRILDIDENLDSASATKQPGERSSVLAFESEKKSKLLELEKQEAIGEILKLNVSYKAPPDYKPLLKEDRVSIPVKEYPGYNFIGLIFGPGGDNRKRLEKETGTRIQVYGVKAGTKDKGEIIPADGNDCQGSYEEIYVHITADTFEKIDAAVSVIELLVTSVSGNLSAASAALGSCQADKENALGHPNSSPHVAPLQVTNPSIFLDAVGASQNPKPVQLQYSSPWFPNSPLTVPANPSSGFIPLSNASAAMLNPGHQMPNMIGPRPAQVTTLNPVTQNQPLILPRPHPSSQFSQNQVIMHPSGVGPPPGNLPLPFQPASPAPPVHSAPIPFPGSQSPRIGPTVMPSFPQTRPDGLRGPQPDCLLVASGASSNMTQVGAPTGPTPLAPQPTVVSAAPMANTAAGSMLTSPNFPSGPAAPHASALPVNHPSPMPMFSSVPPTGPIQSAHGAQGPLIPHAPVHPSRVSMPIPSPLPSGSSVPPFQSSPSSFPGSAPNFTPIRPPASQPPTPHRPNFGDFTFQPQRPQMAQAMRPLAPQPTPFRPPIHDTQPMTPILPRASMGSMVRPQDVSSLIPFSGNPATSLVPPRLPAFPPMGAPPVPLMGQRNLNPAQSPNLAGAFPPRPGNPIEVQRNFHGPMNRPLSQHFGQNSPSFSGMPGQSHGVQQIYDPFSPTSVSNVPQQHGGSSLVAKKQENDPEYEDLMASVGVK